MFKSQKLFRPQVIKNGLNWIENGPQIGPQASPAIPRPLGLARGQKSTKIYPKLKIVCVCATARLPHSRHKIDLVIKWVPLRVMWWENTLKNIVSVILKNMTGISVLKKVISQVIIDFFKAFSAQQHGEINISKKTFFSQSRDRGLRATHASTITL